MKRNISKRMYQKLTVSDPSIVCLTEIHLSLIMYILLSEFLYSLQFLKPPYANEHITRGTRMTPRKQQVSKLIGDCPNRGRPFQTRIWVCRAPIWTDPNWTTPNWTTPNWTEGPFGQPPIGQPAIGLPSFGLPPFGLAPFGLAPFGLRGHLD